MWLSHHDEWTPLQVDKSLQLWVRETSRIEHLKVLGWFLFLIIIEVQWMSLFVAIDSNCGKNKAKVEDEATRHHSVGSSNFRFFFFFFFNRVSTYGVHSWWYLFIIKPKHLSIFGVSEDWTPDLLFNYQRLYQLS